MMRATPILADHPFWQFSCHTYLNTREVLLEMQAHHGLNVNIILFCYWFCINYQKTLSKGDMKHLLATTHLWHQKIINPLRRLRDDLKQNRRLNWVDAIREDVLDTELLAEKIEQCLMVDMFSKDAVHVKKVNTLNAMAHVFCSIKFYCEVLYVTLNDKDCSDFVYIAEKIFPDMKKSDMSKLAHKILLCSHKIEVASNQQLNLELFES